MANILKLAVIVVISSLMLTRAQQYANYPYQYVTYSPNNNLSPTFSDLNTYTTASPYLTYQSNPQNQNQIQIYPYVIGQYPYYYNYNYNQNYNYLRPTLQTQTNTWQNAYNQLYYGKK